MLPVDLGAFGTLDCPVMEAAADRHANREMSGSHSECRAQRRAQRNA